MRPSPAHLVALVAGCAAHRIYDKASDLSEAMRADATNPTVWITAVDDIATLAIDSAKELAEARHTISILREQIATLIENRSDD